MQDRIVRRSNSARTEATKAALTNAARKLFVEKGFAETGTPEIVKAADVTRGALYHHFEDKTALFRAVAEDEARAVATEIAQRTTQDMAPFEAINVGAEAYFDAMSQPGRTRLLLIEGPAVLGLAALAEIDAQTGAVELRKGLAHLVETHDVDIPLDALTNVVSAMFDRAALAIAGGASRDDYVTAIRLFLSPFAPD